MAANSSTDARIPSPADLRNMFGANLRQLARGSQSISALCRDLGINRTQFNRYLSGESFPRPDVLFRICRFFQVDARILLQPVAEIDNAPESIFHHPFLSDYLGDSEEPVPEDFMPSGIYRFSRRSFTKTDEFVVGLVQITRKGDKTFIRGYEAKQAMRDQGLPTGTADREFRGCVLGQDDGISLLISRKSTRTFSFSYLAAQTSFDNNYWVGYTTRTARETVTGSRAARLVFEHLGKRRRDILETARRSGLCTADRLLPYHRTQLQVDTDFR